MALTQLIFLVFCTVLVTGVCSSIVPDLSGLTQAELLQKVKDLDIDADLTDIENHGYTLQQFVQIVLLKDSLKDGETTTRDELAARCSVLVSSNFTIAEGDPSQNRNFKILVQLSELYDDEEGEGEEAQFYKNVFCSYASDPTENVKHAEALRLYRQICRDINSGLGYTKFFVSQNETLTEEQIERFSRYALEVEITSYQKKRKIKGICVYLNESVSIDYIAENAKLSDDQLTKYNSYIPDDDYNYFLEDYLTRQLLQTRNLCNVIIKSDNVREKDGLFYFNNDTELQMKEFLLKTSKILLSPVNDRLELLRGACLTSFTQLYTLES